MRVSGARNEAYDGIFVFDNDMPCVGPNAPRNLEHPAGIYRNRPATGLARVVCYTPRHDLSLAELDAANDYRKKTNIRSSSVYQVTGNLWGGNQQKVVLSKWLFANPEVLILDEPTRGIDVGAKYEIYTIINQLAAQGKAILVISSEMPELLGITDRLYVMNEGRIVGEMPTSEASQEKIMRSIVRAEGKAS